jgi:hypothetical protein
MHQQKPFEFDFYGFHVFGTASLYPDGSLYRIQIDHVLQGMIDWYMLTSTTSVPLVRLMRMHFILEAKRHAATQIQALLTAAACDPFV